MCHTFIHTYTHTTETISLWLTTPEHGASPGVGWYT